jgi:selenocysteine-specific elongation factor
VRSGQRVALNLAGIERVEVERGDVIVSGDALVHATYLVDAHIDLLSSAARPLESGTRVQVHHGTRESPARVAPVNGEPLAPGQGGFVQLRLERQLVPAAGDRLVLRNVAPPDTIGGGTVVDPAPHKHGPGEQHVERLRILASGDGVERLYARLLESPSGLEVAECDRTSLERLLEDGRASLVGLRRQRVFSSPQLQSMHARLERYLERADGRPQSRSSLADAAGVSEPAVRSLLEELVEQGSLVQRGPGFMPAGHEILSDRRAKSLLEALEVDFLQPRGISALAQAFGLAADECTRLLDRLALEGHLVRLRPGLFCHPLALAAAEREVGAICARDGAVTIATLRDAFGSSRKYAQALLEHFDASRVTIRQGDDHVLRRRSADDRAPGSPVR